MYYNFEKFSLTVLLLIISQYASASIISVDAPTGVINDSDGLCSISEAIVNANNDFATYMECTAGNGADTIEIQQNIILTEFNSTDANDGNSGLPVIDSEIIINGNGFLVERDNNLSCNLNDTNEAGEFRLLHNIGVLTVQNIKLYNGCADGSFSQSLGGGILNTGTLSIIDSQFSQNSANEWGGVLLNYGLIIEISNSTFYFNTANQGGALVNSGTGSITEITNSTFSANMATSTAGAILNLNGGMINHISNCSFVNNTSTGSTSVIQNNSNATITNLTNSLFKNNSGTRECANFGGDFNGFNNITDNSSSFCPGDIGSLTPLTVGFLTDNGGPTLTHALREGSEALDAAINGTNNDQRGMDTYLVRDIGAYEVQEYELCPAELFVDGFSTTVNNAQELILAMECSNKNGNFLPDTINLVSDINLNSVYFNHPFDGRTGTPTINSSLIINGQGFEIARDQNLLCDLNDTEDDGEFRLIYNSSVLTLQNIKLENGCADGESYSHSQGGGILNSGILSIINSEISNNKANGGFYGGGGLYNILTVLEISNTTFSNNYSDEGAAILNTGAITGIYNSTFSGNIATDSAAAISNISGSQIDIISNSSFVNNTSENSTSVINNHANAAISNLTNSLFSNNNGSFECQNMNNVFNGSNNISDNQSSGCPGTSSSLTSATVGPLADNGGSTMTHALLADSEALDQALNGTSTDQRGLNAFGTRDIGAYEAQAIELCSSELLIDGFTTTVGSTEDLIIAMECSNLNGNQEIDRIDLSDNIILTTPYENDITTGSIGLPIIETKLFLNGQGFKISRDENLVCDLNGIVEENEFRLLQIEGELSLLNVQLSNGCIDNYDGGSIYNKGLMELINISIENNRSSDNGGGLYHSSGFITSIINSTFSNNTANSGAAMYVLDNILIISNSTFSSNSSLGTAAIRVQYGTITDILNSSFVNNSSPNTSAIQVNSNGTISNMSNSLFSHNVGQSVCSNFGGSFEGANNMADISPSNCPGTINILTNSTIGPLADNGGPTMTHALLVGSEALNNSVNGSNMDQRGYAADGLRDIGAYEAQIPVVTAPNNITLLAQGNTTVVDLGMSTVVDADEAGLLASPNTSGPFAVGTHEIIWAAVDSQGHMGMATQTVTIEIATIGGTVSGLEGNNQVSISDGSQQLVLGNQPYTFDAGLNQGDGYMVNIIGQ
ncbi:MAG: choice-of-anchor Q domain-containing protein, partial [Marinicellaceae bacterium]